MSDILAETQTDSLVDFVIGVEQDGEHLSIEVAVKESGRIIVFHSHRFKQELGWFEFDLATNRLDFVMNDGQVREIGLPLTKDVAIYMQNAHQLLTVLMDPETGEAEEGSYIPLILHRA